jgi:hypothetical protein
MTKVQRCIPLTVVMLCAVIAMPMVFTQAVTGQTDTGEATIEALQTQVAEKEVTIEALTGEPASKRQPPVLTPTATQSDPLSSSVALNVGSHIQTAVWSIAIQHTEEESTIQLYEVFTARGVYLLVTLQVDNLTDLPLEFPYRDLELTDSEGRTYSYQSTITANLLNERYDPLFEYSLPQPDLSYETVVVFELSQQSTSLELFLNDPSGDRANEAETAADVARRQALPSGSSLQFGDWEIGIERTEVQESFSSIWGTHIPRGEFLVLFVTVINTGSEPMSFPYGDIRLVDGMGRWFSFIHPPTDGMALEFSDQQYWEPLQPGVSYHTGIVFDVPPDTDGLVLVASFSEPNLAVEVQKPQA